MENKVMSDSYCEAVAYMIITHAQYLEDKNKAGAFISLFLQSIYKKYGAAVLEQVIKEVKKELTPETLQNLGYKQSVNKGTGIPLYKQSPFLQLLRNGLMKRRKQHVKSKS